MGFREGDDFGSGRGMCQVSRSGISGDSQQSVGCTGRGLGWRRSIMMHHERKGVEATEVDEDNQKQ